MPFADHYHTKLQPNVVISPKMYMLWLVELSSWLSLGLLFGKSKGLLRVIGHLFVLSERGYGRYITQNNHGNWQHHVHWLLIQFLTYTLYNAIFRLYFCQSGWLTSDGVSQKLPPFCPAYHIPLSHCHVPWIGLRIVCTYIRDKGGWWHLNWGELAYCNDWSGIGGMG